MAAHFDGGTIEAYLYLITEQFNETLDEAIQKAEQVDGKQITVAVSGDARAFGIVAQEVQTVKEDIAKPVDVPIHIETTQLSSSVKTARDTIEREFTPITEQIHESIVGLTTRQLEQAVPQTLIAKIREQLVAPLESQLPPITATQKVLLNLQDQGLSESEMKDLLTGPMFGFTAKDAKAEIAKLQPALQAAEDALQTNLVRSMITSAIDSVKDLEPGSLGLGTKFVASQAEGIVSRALGNVQLLPAGSLSLLSKDLVSALSTAINRELSGGAGGVGAGILSGDVLKSVEQNVLKELTSGSGTAGIEKFIQSEIGTGFADAIEADIVNETGSGGKGAKGQSLFSRIVSSIFGGGKGDTGVEGDITSAADDLAKQLQAGFTKAFGENGYSLGDGVAAKIAEGMLSGDADPKFKQFWQHIASIGEDVIGDSGGGGNGGGFTGLFGKLFGEGGALSSLTGSIPTGGVVGGSIVATLAPAAISALGGILAGSITGGLGTVVALAFGAKGISDISQADSILKSLAAVKSQYGANSTQFKQAQAQADAELGQINPQAVTAAKQLAPIIKDIEAALAPLEGPVYSGIVKLASSLKGAMPAITPFLQASIAGMSDFFNEFDKILDSPLFKKNMAGLATTVRPVMDDFGTLILDMGQVMANFLVAAAPLAKAVGAGFVSAFNDLAKASDNWKSFNPKSMEKTFGDIEAIAKAVLPIIIADLDALKGIGMPILNALGEVSQEFNNWGGIVKVAAEIRSYGTAVKNYFLGINNLITDITNQIQQWAHDIPGLSLIIKAPTGGGNKINDTPLPFPPIRWTKSQLDSLNWSQLQQDAPSLNRTQLSELTQTQRNALHLASLMEPTAAQATALRNDISQIDVNIKTSKDLNATARMSGTTALKHATVRLKTTGASKS